MQNPESRISSTHAHHAAWPAARIGVAIGVVFIVGVAVVAPWLAPRSVPQVAHPVTDAIPSLSTLRSDTGDSITAPGLIGAVPLLRPTDFASLAVAGPVAELPGRAEWQAADVPRRAFPNRIERWRPLVREMLAEAWNEGRLDGYASTLDDDIVLAVIQQESSGNPNAVSWAGAIGLMQVMPFTFADMMHGDKKLADEIDLPVVFDVTSNMRAGIRYLALAMQAHEGNVYWALASYNADIEAVDDWRAVGLYAVPPVGGYDETAHYAQVILQSYLSRRPDVRMHIPDPMPYEHVPGAVELLKRAGRW